MILSLSLSIYFLENRHYIYDFDFKLKYEFQCEFKRKFKVKTLNYTDYIWVKDEFEVVWYFFMKTSRDGKYFYLTRILR